MWHLQGPVPNGVDPHVHATSSHGNPADMVGRNAGIASAAMQTSGPLQNGPMPMVRQIFEQESLDL